MLIQIFEDGVETYSFGLFGLNDIIEDGIRKAIYDGEVK